jgi:lipoic acid synthetase
VTVSLWNSFGRVSEARWLKVRAPGSENYFGCAASMRGLKLNTVCEDAHCPNIGECWHPRTATFMILGRRLHARVFVLRGRARQADDARHRRAAARGEASRAMCAEYAGVTSVDRDDLPDWRAPASSRRRSARSTRAMTADTRVEVLIPDFKGEAEPLADAVRANARRSQSQHRDPCRALDRMERSAEATAHAETPRSLAHDRPDIPTKTGLMVGFGEEHGRR